MLDKNGKPLVSGYVQLNQHGTPGIYAQSYSDWNGSLNARNILLDSLGRATAIVENDKLYDMYVYNRYNVLEYSALGVNCSGEGGESSMRFTSSDGSIVITRLNNSVDFKVHSEESSYGTGTGSSVDSQGLIQFDNVDGNITLITADTLSLAASKVYHVTLQLELSTTTTTDSYIDATVNDSENGVHKFQIDGSKSHQYIDISWDLYASKSYAKFYANLPASVSVTAATLYIHAVNSVTVGESGGGGDLPPSTPADEGKVLTVDEDGLPEWRSLGEDSSYAIANGSITFTPGQYYTDGLVTLSNIRSNGVEYAYNNDGWVLKKDHVYVIAYNIVASIGYPESTHIGGRVFLDGFQETDQVWKFALDASAAHDESLVGSAIVCPQNNGEVHLNIRYDSNQLEHIPPAYVNKAEIVDVTAVVSGGGFSQVNSDWNASSGVAEILNKPIIKNVPDVTSSDDSKVLKATYSEGVGSYAWQQDNSGATFIELNDLTSIYSSINDLYNDVYINKKNIILYEHVLITGTSIYKDRYYYLDLESNWTTYEGPYLNFHSQSYYENGAPPSTGGGSLCGNLRFNSVNLQANDPLNEDFSIKITKSTRIAYSSDYPFWVTKWNVLPAWSYRLNDIKFTPTYDSDHNTIIKLYKCKEAYTKTSMTQGNADQDSTHWQQVYFEDYINDIRYRLENVVLNYTPENGTIYLYSHHNNKTILADNDVISLVMDEPVTYIVIQWTVSTSTTLPTVPNTWHASSSNPSSLTVGRTYQLTLKNNCYKIEEFM
jgi:hypothetical protein